MNTARRAYLQIVESRRDGDQVRQQVIATLGRFDELQASGQLERLVRSGARFAAKAMVLSAASNNAAIKIAVRRIGPALVFERLWEETGCRAVIAELVGKRKHGFALERAVFLTVLHRLFVSGSDRAADRWREDYAISGVDGLDLHHLYRAMAWLGEELPQKEQDGRTPFAPRCLKDVIEERLFAHRRDLLTRLDLVFMDTTSLYFEGAGGQTLGQHGYSKDHILGVRERSDKLVHELVLDHPAPFVPLMMKKRGKEIDYEAKTVMVARRRYIVCRNRQEAEKDAADRASIVAALERQLAKGDKALVGNTGFRRYLKTISERHFAIDPDKIEEEKKLDGIFVLRTNTDLNPLEAMLCYKQLWTVEQTFRTAKHLLTTRPIFHKLDETIRGHVFCSFLALVLKTELEERIAVLERVSSWPEIIADLDSLTETEIEYDGKHFIVRSAPRPAATLALRAAGVALPPTIRDAAVS